MDSMDDTYVHEENDNFDYINCSDNEIDDLELEEDESDNDTSFIGKGKIDI